MRTISLSILRLGPTRAASDDELRELLRARLDSALQSGTTTIEVKTGYDLTADGELRLLRNIGGLASTGSPRVVPRTIIPEVRQPQSGNALYVFALPEKGR